MTQEHISQEQIESIYTRYGGDMTNCASAIARQAVENYVDQKAKKLPTLPELTVMWLYIGAWEAAEPPALDKCGAVNEIVLHMLRVYGQECAAHALEKAAKWLDFYDGLNMRRAEAIRQMKADK